MIEHGIHTSKADYWLHIHPLEPFVYWYSVELCLHYIRRNNIPVFVGRSKDKSETGAGYLIPKRSWFVRAEELPYFVCRWPWKNMTDREAGDLGQDLVKFFVENGEISLPKVSFNSMRSKSDQFDGLDFELIHMKDMTFEVKTELYESGNLFVQVREGGHKVHVAPSGETRITEIDPLGE